MTGIAEDTSATFKLIDDAAELLAPEHELLKLLMEAGIDDEGYCAFKQRFGGEKGQGTDSYSVGHLYVNYLLELRAAIAALE